MPGPDRASVAQSTITRIDQWVGRHATRARAGLRPPAPMADLAAASAVTRRVLPPDLRAMWELTGGARRGVGADGGRLIPPRFAPCSPREAVCSLHL